MEARSIFSNLSSLDHRYYLANKELFEALGSHLSEDAVIRSSLEAEAALLKTHIAHSDLDGEKYNVLIDTAVSEVDPADVYAEEEKTQHNIRALVHVFKRHLPEEIRHFVHLGATSVDILDTAWALRLRGATRKVILPLLIELEKDLAAFAREQAGTAQVGRTHGQYAVPVTLGFSMAEYVSRLGKSIVRIEELSKDLRGKLAGAVGAYNATSMLSQDPIAFEACYLGFLDLKPSEHSTQMVEPEYALRLLLEMNVAFGVLANLADDLRNLQRSEINELREVFTSSQVGSSTMPQKRNPWNSEHVKSLWKAFYPRVMTFYADQISEHQRDLTNSASSRFIPDYLAGFSAAANRMKKVVNSLQVQQEDLQRHVKDQSVLAEAAYILLARAGESEAHELIKQITLKLHEKNFAEALKEHGELWNILKQQLSEVGVKDPEAFFEDPAQYNGRAEEKALEISERYIQLMDGLGEKIS
jgi:adenylosuccinate lyase